MSDLATLFTTILVTLRQAVAVYAARAERIAHATNTPHTTAAAHCLVLAWARIGRATKRLQSLFVRFQAGTLPAPVTTPRPTRQRAPRPHIPFPRRHAWLAASRHDVCGAASQLHHLFAHPDLPSFLAAAPQAGRILRPLCHMLGIDPPPQATLPPRPKRPRASKPPPPPPPRPPFAHPTPDRPLPRHIRAAARAWRI